MSNAQLPPGPRLPETPHLAQTNKATEAASTFEGPPACSPAQLPRTLRTPPPAAVSQNQPQNQPQLPHTAPTGPAPGPPPGPMSGPNAGLSQRCRCVDCLKKCPCAECKELLQSAMSSATAQQPPTVPLAQVVTTQPPTTPTQPVQPSPPSQAPVMGNAATAPNVPADTTASAAQVLSSIAQQNASPSSRVQCDHCKQWVLAAQLDSHKRSHTQNAFGGRLMKASPKIKCHACDILFLSLEDFSKHLADEHRDKPFVCVVCYKLFARKSNLTRHERIHTGEKRFACHLCPKKFTEKHHLNAHVRTHTGEKPYKCRYCSRAFTDRSNMLRHSKTHTEEELSSVAMIPANLPPPLPQSDGRFEISPVGPPKPDRVPCYRPRLGEFVPLYPMNPGLRRFRLELGLVSASLPTSRRRHNISDLAPLVKQLPPPPPPPALAPPAAPPHAVLASMRQTRKRRRAKEKSGGLDSLTEAALALSAPAKKRYKTRSRQRTSKRKSSKPRSPSPSPGSPSTQTTKQRKREKRHRRKKRRRLPWHPDWGPYPSDMPVMYMPRQPFFGPYPHPNFLPMHPGFPQAPHGPPDRPDRPHPQHGLQSAPTANDSQ